MTDPIPGVDVKLGRKPPGAIIASGVTDAKGQFEFKNLAEGTGYYLEYAIKEQGVKSAVKTRTVVMAFACTSGPDKSATPKVMTEKWDGYESTITVSGNTIRGSINISRSNIKR